MAALMVILLLVPLVLRGYARRVEAGADDVPDQVHRIRRAQTAAVLALPVLEVIMLAEAYGEGRLLLTRLPAWHGAPVVAGALLVFLVVFIGGAVLCYLATYPATARIRGLPSQAGRAGRRQARMLFALLVPQLIWVTIWVTAHTLHGTAQLAALPLWLAYLVGVVVFLPKLMPAILRTKPVDGGVRQRLLRLADEHQVKIRDVRCLDTGPEQMANAMVMGLLPRSRYVLVTDRLLRDLEPDELDAVLAHELGHAKQHHLLIKLGAMLVAWLPAVGLVVGAGLIGHRSPPLAVALAVLAMVLVMASLVVIQGLVGVRLERSADDYASATAGPDPLRRGLEKLAAANAIKRRTGRMWNLLTQHPGLDQRVDRLRTAGAAREAQTAG